MMSQSPVNPMASDSVHRYQLGLLGGFSLSCNGRQLKTLTAPRLQSLLGFLVLNGGKMLERSALASAFWPELAEETARSHLRKNLFKLREALPASDTPLELTKTGVAWHAETTCDVVELEGLLLQPPSATLVSRIHPLYVGPLLPGCTDAWCLERREQVEQRVLHTLDTVLEQQEQGKAWAELIEVSRLRLQLDALNEETHHRLFRAFVALGDKQAARKVWLECCAQLAQGLDVEPSAPFQRDWERLSAGTPGDSPAPVVLPQNRLVGRTLEWRTLQDAWNTAGQGQARAVLVSGVSGIGKTRLATEMRQWVERQGVVTACSECRLAEQRLAFSALSELLEGLPSPALSPQILSEVSRLLPSLSEAHPGLPQPPHLHEPGQRQRFFQAVARYATEKEPLLLLLDDAQWADEPTLEWLLYLIRIHPAKKVLLVVTVRPETLGPEHYLLQEFLPTLRKLKRLDELSLGPLSLQESGELIVQEARGAVSHHVIDELHVEAEGTPLYLLELLRARHLEGGRTLRAGEYPHTLTDAVALRLSALPSPARATLELIATLGAPAQPRLLAEALGKSELEVVDALDVLRTRHLVEERSDLSYRMAHGLIGAILYRMMSLAHRRLLHKTLAERLERQTTDGEHEGVSQVAYHFDQAQLHDRAAQYYMRAGEASLALGAMGEARRLLEKALACTGAAVEVQIRALELLFDVNHWAGAFSTCLEQVQELQRLLQQTGDGRALAMAYVKESNVLQFVGRLSEAGEPLTRALAVEVEGGGLLRQEALLLRAELRLHHLLLEDIEADYQQALLELRGLDVSEFEPGDHIPGIITLISNGRLGEAQAEIAQAREVAIRANRRDCESVLLYWRGFVHMVQGDLDQADADIRESIRLAKGAETVGSVIKNQLNLARLQGLRGHLRTAITLGLELDAALAPGSAGERMRLEAELGLMLGLSGASTRAQDRLKAALDGAIQSGNRRAFFRWKSYQTTLALAFGRLDEADQHVQEILPLLTWNVLDPVCQRALAAAQVSADGGAPGTLIDLACGALALKGELLLRRGAPEQALPVLERAARLRPLGLMMAPDWDPAISWAEALLMLDRIEEGRTVWWGVHGATEGAPSSCFGLPRFLAVGARLEAAAGGRDAADRLWRDARRALHRLSLEVSEPESRRALLTGSLWHQRLEQEKLYSGPLTCQLPSA